MYRLLKHIGLHALLFFGGALMIVPLCQAKTVVLLALGDSLTAGYSLPPGLGFAPRLEAALKGRGYDVRVIDGGVSGDTSADGLARLEWMLGDLPDVAIVELGANDALRGLPPQQTMENLKQIVSRLQQSKVTVLLAGMRAPPNLGESYGSAFSRIFPTVASAQRVPLYPFFIGPIAANPAFLLNDGLHPTAEGVERLVAGILPSVKALLPKGNPP